MTWIEKVRPSPFDDNRIPGFCMLDGDYLFTLTRDEQFRGVKRPMIAFPSGINRALWPSRAPEYEAEFFLFGEMALPVRASREAAYRRAAQLAARYEYGAAEVGDQALDVWDERDFDHFRVTYDTDTGYVANVVSMLTAINYCEGG